MKQKQPTKPPAIAPAPTQEQRLTDRTHRASQAADQDTPAAAPTQQKHRGGNGRYKQPPHARPRPNQTGAPTPHLPDEPAA